MSTRIIHTGLILLVIFLAPLIARGAVIEQLIAVINGEPYTRSNLNGYAKSKMARGFPTGDLAQINAADREVLEQFITDKLLDIEVRESGINIGEDDVERYIDQVKKNQRLSDQDFAAALSREGMAMAAYKVSVKSELEKAEIIDRQVRRRVNITEEDIDRYYKLNQKNYRGMERARIRHILLSLPENAPAERVQEVFARSRELYRRIVAGEDFAGLAREFSEGAGRAEGGDIGWFNKGTLLAGLEVVAFQKLSPGQVSEPFRTSMGYHIVKLDARDSGTLLPLSQVAPKIKEELLSKALEERFARWLKTDLRRKHRVDVKIAGVSFKPEDTKDGTVNSLMAKSTRPARREERSVLSYFNPLSYIVKETPFEEEDPKSPLANKSIVSVFGVPLFTTESGGENIPDVLAPSAPGSGAEPSGGFFSSIFDSLNPFSKK